MICTRDVITLFSPTENDENAGVVREECSLAEPGNGSMVWWKLDDPFKRLSGHTDCFEGLDCLIWVSDKRDQLNPSQW